MKSVFIVVRDYDIEGYRIAGVYDNRGDAAIALLRNNEDGYGMKTENRVVELPLNTYFDISDIEL